MGKKNKRIFMQKIIFIFFLCLQTLLFAQESVVLGIQDSHFQKLGMNKKQVEIWEDGMHTSGGKNTYEWWYFDMILADSSKLVVVFYTKPLQEVASAKMNPCITVAMAKKNGLNFKKTYHIPLADCNFSKEKCEVKMGKSYIKGDLKQYEIHLDLPDIQADIQLASEVPAWRPGTGYMYFGKEEKYYFAWLPSVAKGKISGTFCYQNQCNTLIGSGYHDHNWGNYNLYFLMNHWYWSRIDIGEYTLITSQMTGAKKYNYAPTSVFMIAKKGEILAENGKNMKFIPTQRMIEPITQRPLYQHLIFEYEEGEKKYVLTLQQKEIIEKSQFTQVLKGVKKGVARLFNVNPTYLRMTGDASLIISEGDKSETLKGDAIWEQFYFRKNID